jgi:hypothetical protein
MAETVRKRRKLYTTAEENLFLEVAKKNVDAALQAAAETEEPMSRAAQLRQLTALIALCDKITLNIDVSNLPAAAKARKGKGKGKGKGKVKEVSDAGTEVDKV